MFGPHLYSYSAITYTLHKLSFGAEKEPSPNEEEDYAHQQRINLIQSSLEDYPFSSINQLAQNTGIPKTSVYRIVTGDLGYVLKHLKWIPYDLNSSQKLARVNLSKSLLTILQQERRNNYYSIITGDESWFYLSTNHEAQWLPPGKEVSKRERKMVTSKKIMLSIFWNPEGFHLVKVVPEDTVFDKHYFINEILCHLSDLVSLWEAKMIIHFDNAPPHKAADTT